MIFNESASAIEKTGILATIAVGILAIWRSCVALARWVSGIGEERAAFRKHIADTAPMIPRFIRLEHAAEQAAEERGAIIEEIRGLRKDIHEVLMFIARRNG